MVQVRELNQTVDGLRKRKKIAIERLANTKKKLEEKDKEISLVESSAKQLEVLSGLRFRKVLSLLVCNLRAGYRQTKHVKNRCFEPFLIDYIRSAKSVEIRSQGVEASMEF